mmetsp:Transcript_15152/g.40657  ORF Transcript_15152/g.40657 Transcript_15152/m.40657 type:complete len:591 (+) Transcript_15152:182-1954(+)
MGAEERRKRGSAGGDGGTQARETAAVDASAGDGQRGWDGGVEARSAVLGMSRRKLRGVSDRRLKDSLQRSHRFAREAVESAAEIGAVMHADEPGFVRAEGELERTYQASQRMLRAAVDSQTARRAEFELDLRDTLLGPYVARYAGNGRGMLVAGRLGHVALFDWRRAALACELHLNETVRDATFLHSDALFALAQRKYVYIYDRNGVELHCLRYVQRPTHLEFLPAHFLLAAVAEAGVLSYTDVTSGEIVAELRTRTGRAAGSALNPWNGCVHLAHGNGTVSMWSPTSSTPLVKLLCHRGSVSSLAVLPDGQRMATAGLTDGTVKLWDLRMWRELMSVHTFRAPTDMSASQRGVLALAMGPHVHFYRTDRDSVSASSARGASQSIRQKHVVAPYLKHTYGGFTVESVHFCPFEDILAVGHTGGISSLLVPGAGEPVFDSRVANPFETKSQRREREVRTLLDKLAPSTIGLSPDFVASVDRDPAARLEEIRASEKAANDALLKRKSEKKRSRGRSKIAKSLARKRKNVIDEATEKLRSRYAAEREQRANAARSRAQNASSKGAHVDGYGGSEHDTAEIEALARFYKRKPAR